jgi:hypothetical protein
LLQRQQALEEKILARAEEQAEEFESCWVRPPAKRTGTDETFPPTVARYVRLTVTGVDTNPAANTGYRIDEFEVWTAGPSRRNVALASNGGRALGTAHVPRDFADAYSAKLTVDGEYGARWHAASPELTIVLAKPETIDHVVFSSDRPAAAGNHPVAAFACEYRIEVSLDGDAWLEVAHSRDRAAANAAHRQMRLVELVKTAEERQQMGAWNGALAETQHAIREVPPLPEWWVGQFRQPRGKARIFLGGDPQRRGDVVAPASLQALANTAGRYSLPNDAPEQGRRLKLAHWIASPHNPLTSRVLVNRLWQHHFGTGIVATPSDFGFMGGRPTHPKLLDWLARELIHGGWRLKPLHKRIMLSATYRQASDFRSAAAEVDAASRFLWRYPPRRLQAEEIRDTILSIAGKLRVDGGGPGFRLYDYLEDNVATYVPRDTIGPETYRRAVYHQNARATRVDLLSDFDRPDCAFAAPRRATTTTPLQALTLMNHRFTLDMAQFLVERLEEEVGPGQSPQHVRRAFALAFGRPPTADESKAALHLAQRFGLRAFCRAVLNANPLVYID